MIRLQPLWQILIVSTVGYIILAQLLSSNVRPWPDEAIYADIAQNIIAKHSVSSTLWQGMIPGVDKMAAWNPPAYFLLTAFAFLIAQPSLAAQRAISVICGLGVLWLSILITYTALPRTKKNITWFVAAGLLVDYQFMVSTQLARPEIVVLLLGMLSWYFQIRGYNSATLSPRMSLVCGGLVGLATLFHPLGLFTAAIGGIYWLLHRWRRTGNSPRLMYYIIGILLPILVWLIAIHPYWPLMIKQYALASARKYQEIPWIFIAFTGHIPTLEAVFSMMGLGYIYLLFNLKRQAFDHYLWWFTGIALIFGLVAAAGKMLWYIAYAIPFFYIALGYAVSRVKKAGFFGWMIAAGVVLVNAFITYSLLVVQGIPAKAYTNYCQKILAQIPDRTSVFLTAIPDPYYCFLDNHRKNTLTEFPTLSMPLSTYASVLHNVDYAVVMGYYDSVLFGNFLDQYLSQNADQRIKVYDGVGYYSAFLVKLLPYSQRKMPLENGL